MEPLGRACNIGYRVAGLVFFDNDLVSRKERQRTFGQPNEPIAINGRVSGFGFGLPAFVRVFLEGPTPNPEVRTFDTISSPLGDYFASVLAEQDGRYNISAQASPWPLFLGPPPLVSARPPLVIGTPVDVQLEQKIDSLRTIDLADRQDAPVAKVFARHWAAATLMTIGNPEEANQHLTVGLAVAERLRDRRWLTSMIFLNEFLSHLRGDWQAARAFNERNLAIAGQDPIVPTKRALLEYEVGNFGQGEVYLEQLLEVMGLAAPGPTGRDATIAVTIPMIARITGITDRLNVTEAEAGVVMSSGSATPHVIILSTAGLGLVAVLRNDVTAAGEKYAALESVQGTMILPPGMSGDRLLGLLSQTMGNLGDAQTHFEDALAFCRNAGYRPELAWTCCDYADTLLQRNNSGDRENAISLLDESLAISSELGMRPLMERVLSRREIRKA